jgi:hypothetical protein
MDFQQSLEVSLRTMSKDLTTETEKILLIKTLTTGSGKRQMRVFLLLLGQEVMLPQRVINTGRILVTQLLMDLKQVQVVLDFLPSLVALLK